jgi:hypothetical protein
MNTIHKNLFRAYKMSLISLGILFCFVTQTHAVSFTLVKTIDLNPLVGDNGSIEVDVVGDELYVANWIQDVYYRIDPVAGNVLGSFSLGNSILMDNHGSEYNPTTGRILHTSDDDAGGALGFDAFFETDTTGVLLNGPFDLFGAGDNSEDPEGLTVDPATGRIWVSAVSYPGDIFEINPNDGTILNQVIINSTAGALGFNPNYGKIFFADSNGVIKEVAPDGTDLSTVFNPNVGVIFGMAFTPTGDLVLLDFASGSIPPPSRLLLYDSSDDADNVFTTTPDTDGDGIPDDEDACINSDLGGTVTIDGCDSGVENELFVDGCTISDLIWQCAEDAKNHGKFVSAVSHITSDLKKEGAISGKDKGKIQQCAAGAYIP